jgi:hypothetical protein
LYLEQQTMMSTSTWLPPPYFHTNVDSDEVLYYVDGEFMSRKHMERGQITLHPSEFGFQPLEDRPTLFMEIIETGDQGSAGNLIICEVTSYRISSILVRTFPAMNWANWGCFLLYLPPRK